jgi:TonB family protein
VLPERVRAGLLAFDTGQGLAYAEPSFWQRVHLLWTFRNFRRLSKKVLNPRQRQLIESLYLRSSLNAPARPHAPVVIGTVEDFSLPSPSPALVADTTRHGEVSEGNVPSKPIRPRYVGLVFSAGRLIFAGALCIIIVMLAWYQWPVQQISFAGNVGDVTTVQPPAKAGATQRDVRQVIEPVLSTEPHTIPASQISNAEGTVSLPIGRLSGAESRESRTPKVLHAVNKRADAAKPPVAHETQEEARRIQIPGAPLRLLYPTYPQTSVHGKVILKAVIGYDGKVKEVRVLNGNQVLAAAAMRAIRQWRYVPYHKDGRALEAEANIIVSFIARDVITVSFPAGAPLPR